MLLQRNGLRPGEGAGCMLWLLTPDDPRTAPVRGISATTGARHGRRAATTAPSELLPRVPPKTRKPPRLQGLPVMRWRGLEPPRPCGHKALNFACSLVVGACRSTMRYLSSRVGVLRNVDSLGATTAATAAAIRCYRVHPSVDGARGPPGGAGDYPGGQLGRGGASGVDRSASPRARSVELLCPMRRPARAAGSLSRAHPRGLPVDCLRESTTRSARCGCRRDGVDQPRPRCRVSPTHRGRSRPRRRRCRSR